MKYFNFTRRSTRDLLKNLIRYANGIIGSLNNRYCQLVLITIAMLLFRNCSQLETELFRYICLHQRSKRHLLYDGEDTEEQFYQVCFKVGDESAWELTVT